MRLIRISDELNIGQHHHVHAMAMEQRNGDPNVRI